MADIAYRPDTDTSRNQNTALNASLDEKITTRPVTLNAAIRTKGFEMPDFHYHTSYELFYIKSGRADFFINEKIYSLTDGDLLIIPPFVPHRSKYAKSQTAFRFEISIMDSQLSESLSHILGKLAKNICYTISLKYQDVIVKLLEQLDEEFHFPGEYADEMISAYVSELLILFHRHTEHSKMPGSLEDRLPEEIMEYITQNYSHRLTIAELAAHFHVSESTIYKTFKKYTGLRVTDYINFTRVMNAERMILETQLPLTEISNLCGFTDSNYFSSVFKKYKNMTPAKFRNTHALP